MKKHLVTLLIFLLANTICLAQSSWKSPDYKAKKYNKILVLAKIADPLAKRQLEDATVSKFKEKGFDAIPSYLNFTDSDSQSEETFLAKAISLGIDALLTYTITANNTEYKNTPSLNASIGVPVRLGIFGGFLGTNVPIAGGTKSVSSVKMTASFYNKDSKNMQWSFPLSGKLKKDTNKLANTCAKTTVSAIIKDRLFLY